MPGNCGLPPGNVNNVPTELRHSNQRVADGIFHHLLQQEFLLSHQNIRADSLLRQEDLLRHHRLFHHERVHVRLAYLRVHPVLLRREQL